MADWVILVDTPKDFPNADTPHKVITTKDYLARSNLFRGTRPKIINLSRSFAYQSRGYYCSLLAEARGHRVIPSVETMVDLGARQLYAQARARARRRACEVPRRGRRQDHAAPHPRLFRHRRGPPLRPLRPAALRLVPLPGARGHRREWRPPADQAPRRRAGDQAVAGRAAALSRGAPRAHHAANGARRRTARRRATPSPPSTIPTRSCRRPASRRSSTGRASPRSSASRSSRSPSATWRGSPSSTRCSSARPRRSTITPTASRGGRCRRACRSSTTRSR